MYAFLAGFRTVHDYDIGWQLATARWIVQHHQIPGVDVLSYTAKGRPWIYPVLSGLVFYALYCIGGFSALTWLTASASALTTFLLTARRSIATSILAIIAVPVIMNRLDPRADLFSTVLFAALLAILCTYHRTGRGWLWLLPVILFFWVNLHWGFVAGLGLGATYVLLEACEMLSPARRDAARWRLRNAWPWLGGTVLATFFNPWGPGLYRGVLTWFADLRAGASAQTGATITLEYNPLRFNPSTLAGALNWRNPGASAIWWLLVLACVAIVVCVIRRNYGAAVFLAGSALAGIHAYRFQGMFACVVVIIGGAILDESLDGFFSRSQPGSVAGSSILGKATVAVCVLFIVLAGVRCYDLVSNRYYANSLPFEFGSGLSWWYPERALAFIEREHLPGNIYNTLVVGGYLAWRLPQYPDFIDGRGRPFAGDVFESDEWLPLQGPESPGWQNFAERYGINTLVIPVTRISGLEYFPNFQYFCSGRSWRPVYLDEVTAVFLRRTLATQSLIDRLQVDCATVRFSPPSATAFSIRARADLFNFWTNAAVVYLALGRGQGALDATEIAQGILEPSAHLHMERGSAFQMLNRPSDAEREYRRSVELEPTASNLYELAKLLWVEQRTDEAIADLREAAELSLQPLDLYFHLAYAELKTQHPKKALEAFDQTVKADTKRDDTAPQVAELHARIAEGRSGAWMQLGDSRRALEFELEAVQLTPRDPDRWRELASLYQSLGRTSDAEDALQKAKQLSVSTPPLTPTVPYSPSPSPRDRTQQ